MCRDPSPLLLSGTVCSHLSANELRRQRQGGWREAVIRNSWRCKTLQFLRLIHWPLDSFFFFGSRWIGYVCMRCHNNCTRRVKQPCNFFFSFNTEPAEASKVSRNMWPGFSRASFVHLQTSAANKGLEKGSQRSHVTFEKVTHNLNNTLILWDRAHANAARGDEGRWRSVQRLKECNDTMALGADWQGAPQTDRQMSDRWTDRLSLGRTGQVHGQHSVVLRQEWQRLPHRGRCSSPGG